MTQCELNLVCSSILLNANVGGLTCTKLQIGQYSSRPVSITWKLETPWCLWSWSGYSTQKRTVSQPRCITQVPESRLLESRGLCPFRDLYPVDLTLHNPAQGAMWVFLALKCIQSSLWWNRQVIDLLQITRHWDSCAKNPESVDLDVAVIAGNSVVGGVSAVLLIVLGIPLSKTKEKSEGGSCGESTCPASCGWTSRERSAYNSYALSRWESNVHIERIFADIKMEYNHRSE